MKFAARRGITNLIKILAICVFAVFLGGIFTQARAANILLNGGLETWTSGVPNNFTKAGGTGTFTQVTTGVSPFTTFATLGSSAGKIDPALNTGTTSATLSQTFTAQTGLLQGAVEFKFDTLPTNGNVFHWSYDNTVNTAFRLSLGANFGKYTSNQSGIVNILPLTAGTWYQVVVDIDVTNQVISGGIRPFGGTFTKFSQPFSSSVSSITRALSPAKGFIPSGAHPNQAITFDNIYLGNAVVTVPEPSSIGLLALGGFALLRVRRRTRAS